MVTAEVSYQVGTYHGTIEVTCDPGTTIPTP